MKSYKEEKLKEFGVYELRELARRLGISSATTKKRKELEELILKISCGEMIPQKISVKGRPPKSIKKIESVLDIFVPKELTEVVLNKKIAQKVSASLQFAQSKVANPERVEVKGFLRKTQSNNYYFKVNLSNEILVSVPDSFINEHSLIEGDKIEGVANQLTSYYVLVEIESINNHQVLKNRDLKKNDQVVLKEVPLKNLEGVNEGENVLFIGETFKDSISKMKETIKPLFKLFKVVALAPNISVYTKLQIEKDFEGEFIYSLLEDHPIRLYDATIDAINHVNSLLLEGNKVILVLFDIFGILNGLEMFFAIENERTNNTVEAVRITKRIFNTGKVLQTGASITTFASCLSHEKENSFYKNDLIKNADKIFKK